eukprot:CAMPEP_0174258778 /NCGR_PEP_ID=MMETSP0439-20130205/7721_1 /TAXON_ID=0 /ORGANISM="Stereomyxa ramosa, Strain Chinc5" /LENGTH=44 /DNA_ID= /DNA_START= /DNA_END= /DNA_ORIENTATION=
MSFIPGAADIIIPILDSSEASTPLAYFPVKRPDARGDHVVKPRS